VSFFIFRIMQNVWRVTRVIEDAGYRIKRVYVCDRECVCVWSRVHVKICMSALVCVKCVAVCCSEWQCRVAVCCSVLQCVAVCCSVLQCVAVCCSVVVQCVESVVCANVYECIGACAYTEYLVFLV